MPKENSGWCCFAKDSIWWCVYIKSTCFRAALAILVELVALGTATQDTRHAFLVGTVMQATTILILALKHLCRRRTSM